MNKCRIIIWILGIICFIFNILTPIFVIWTHVSLQVLFYINFFFLCLIYITILLNEISIYGKYLENFNNKLEKRIILFNFTVFFLFIYFYAILFINLLDFQKFIRNCPYYLDKLDYDLNYDRRCELYDINYNSRYSYQYICSYDSSKDFAEINKEKLKQEIKPDKVICVKYNELIDNIIINKFKEVYNKKDKYYCSRTNIPQESDYSFAKAKDCRMSKNSFLLFGFIAYFYPLWYFLGILMLTRKRSRERFRDIHVNLRLDRNFNHDNFINLGRRNIANINNAISSNASTERSENPGRNINFRPEKTINIIIENKNQFIINQNIKKLSNDKINKMDNHINSENINELNLNSDEVIFRRDVININNQ